MHAFIALHANAIIALSSATYITISTVSAITDWQCLSLGASEPKFAACKALIFAFSCIIVIIFTGVYIYATSFASPRMNSLFGFTNLYCILMFTVRDGFKAKTKKGYTYAGVCIAIIVVAGILTAFAPLPST